MDLSLPAAGEAVRTEALDWLDGVARREPLRRAGPAARPRPAPPLPARRLRRRLAPPRRPASAAAAARSTPRRSSGSSSTSPAAAPRSCPTCRAPASSPRRCSASAPRSSRSTSSRSRAATSGGASACRSRRPVRTSPRCAAAPGDGDDGSLHDRRPEGLDLARPRVRALPALRPHRRAGLRPPRDHRLHRADVDAGDHGPQDREDRGRRRGVLRGLLRRRRRPRSGPARTAGRRLEGRDELALPRAGHGLDHEPGRDRGGAADDPRRTRPASAARRWSWSSACSKPTPTRSG